MHGVIVYLCTPLLANPVTTVSTRIGLEQKRGNGDFKTDLDK